MKQKKIILLFLFILFFSGCSYVNNNSSLEQGVEEDSCYNYARSLMPETIEIIDFSTSDTNQQIGFASFIMNDESKLFYYDSIPSIEFDSQFPQHITPGFIRNNIDYISTINDEIRSGQKTGENANFYYYEDPENTINMPVKYEVPSISEDGIINNNFFIIKYLELEPLQTIAERNHYSIYEVRIVNFKIECYDEILS